MALRSWKDKPFAVVHPRHGQKYRVAQLCATWHTTGRPSVQQLADVFGISPGLIYLAMRMARPPKHGKGHARRAKANGDRPAERKIVIKPMPIIEPTDDAWAIAQDLVHTHGVDTVFDRVILPAIT
jgi:hypothetical protein